MRIIYLTCLAGPLKSRIFNLDGGPVFIFGRYGKAHFSLANDPAASHLHFLIDASENRVRIIDLGSTNGLIINDRHLGGKQGKPFTDFIPLKSGDTILAGASLFRLTVEEESTIAYLERLARMQGKDSRPEIKGTRPPGGGNLTTVMPKAGDKANGHVTEDAGSTAVNLPKVYDSLLPTVEGYTIVEKIGGGGKGVVFRAIKNDSGATAAIKMMNFNRSKAKKQRSIETFRREIQITRQLEHPNIIRYLGDGISQGAPYLALEYVAGGNLDELIRQSPGRRMDLPQAIPLFIQILEAVAHMHSRSLVHRDIKPKNVLLDLRRGGYLAAKLSDMGLSCRFSNLEADDFLPIISEGGTPAYMPPEQLTDLTRAIPQSDVFSSAATFYHMLTGSLLYDFSPDRDQNEVIIEGNIKTIDELRPDLPEAIAEVITKSLSPQPEKRYANAHEMLGAFKMALS